MRAPKGGPEAHNFALFSLSRHNFLSFFLSWGCFQLNLVFANAG